MRLNAVSNLALTSGRQYQSRRLKKLVIEALIGFTDGSDAIMTMKSTVASSSGEMTLHEIKGPACLMSVDER